MYEQAMRGQAVTVGSLIGVLGEAKQSPISSALNQLHKSINVLEEAVQSIQERAGSVTVPAPPAPCGEANCAAPSEAKSQSRHEINSASDRILSISAKLRELTSRLET